ncbi:hypothetical protein AB0C31_30055, partial [Actinoplanes philippinensis]
GDLPYRPGEATFIYRARSEEEVAFRAELEWFAHHRGVRLIFLLGPRAARPSWLPAPHAGHSNAVMPGHSNAAASRHPGAAMPRQPDAGTLRQLVPEIARSHVYLCGPAEWTAAARTAAEQAGTPAGNVHTEQFSW